MQNIQSISATKARNNFFSLLKQSYLHQKTFLVKKNDIPMVYIIPTTLADLQDQDPLAIFNLIHKNQKNMVTTTDSVKILRQIRHHA